MIESLVLASVGVVGSSLVGSLADFLRSKYGAQQALKAASPDKLTLAIESQSLAALGSYLENDLGAATISDYARDKSVRDRLDGCLARIEHLIGEDVDRATTGASAEAPSGDGTVRPVVKAVEPTSEGHSGFDELDALLHQVGDSPSWDILFRVRLITELTLRQLATDLLNPRSPVTAAIKVLESSGVLNRSSARLLRWSYSVASAAIHGAHVQADTVVEVISTTSRAFRESGITPSRLPK